MKTKAMLFSALLAAAIGVCLVGCATSPYSSSAPSQADLLSQSGFRTYTATTPERVAAIKSLPAKKVVSNQYQGKVTYLVCPNPNSNQCYLGDRAAYDRYQQLAIQQSITEDQRKVQEQRYDPEWWPMYMDSQGGG